MRPKAVWEENTGYLFYFYPAAIAHRGSAPIQIGVVGPLNIVTYISTIYTYTYYTYPIKYAVLDNNYNFAANDQPALFTVSGTTLSPISTNNNTSANFSVAYNQQSRKLTIAYDEYTGQGGNNSSKARLFGLTYRNKKLQPTPGCNTDPTMLWTEETAYDEYGNIVAQSRSYIDILGRTTQVQTRNIAENKILASEILYDKQGRPVLQTLPAPTYAECFTYNNKFIASPSVCANSSGQSNCTKYDPSDFDNAWNTGASGEINNPLPVGAWGGLGAYYNIMNTAELYVPESSYPYSRIDYNDRIVKGQVRSSGPGEKLRMGQGHEAKSIVLPLLTELDANYLPIRNALTGETTASLKGQGTKTITTDQNGKETVTFRDKSGRPIATATGSGTQYTTTTTRMGNTSAFSFWELFIPIQGVSLTQLIVNANAGKYIEVYQTSDISFNPPVGYSANLQASDMIYQGAAEDFSFTSVASPFYMQVRALTSFSLNATVLPSGSAPSQVTYTSTPVGSPSGGSWLDVYAKDGKIEITSNPSGAFELYDLVKGGLVNTYAAGYTGTITLPVVSHNKGLYRIQALGTGPGTLPPVSRMDGNNGITVKHSYNYSDWSYVFYDDAGMPLKEVSPKGVNLSSTAVPTQFCSDYTYNTLGWTLSSKDSDRGLTEYVYQKDGQLRFSQDARQHAENKFSYISYKLNGEMSEQGEYASSSGSLWFQNTKDYATVPAPALKDSLNNTVTGTSIGTILESTDGLVDSKCAFVNILEMHTPDAGLAAILTAAGIPAYTQRYLNSRISKSCNRTNASSSTDLNTTWYSYDEQGRMEWMVQKVDGLADPKTIHYEYGLLGNLKRTIYQKGTSAERFEHQYRYDPNLRLSSVKTRAGTALLQQEALYKYYPHGPLKRTELADKLQGIDYVYTINGMLKSINHPTLNSAKDPGKDSYTGSNSAFAPDVFGMQLQYFDQDYVRASASIVNAALNTGTYAEQFSGAVQGMEWQVKDNGISGSMLMYAFQYDDKYQMLNADFGTVAPAAPTAFVQTSPSPFNISNTYDQNGNLLVKIRKDASGADQHNFVYNYTTAGTNQLGTISTGGTVTRNYEYDKAGKCTTEYVSGTTLRSMIYNPYDLVTEVKAGTGSGVTRAKFYYNERGQRVKKETYDNTGNLQITTWYVPDAGGNILSTYYRDHSTSNPTQQSELPIYGMGRIGEARKNGTSPIAYTYELHDHLGTVRATINRVKSSGLAVIETWADYYADGEVMQGGTGAPRSGTGTLASRFGYQGQFAEKDPETGLLAFDLRMYDVTLGKWISPDPMSQDFSPYNGMGNNPVSMFDPTGGKWRPHTLAGKILKVAVVVVAVAAATAAVVMVPGVAGALGAICALDGTIIAGTVGGTALIGGAIGGTAAVFSLSNSSNPYNGTGGNSSNGTGGNVSNAIAQQQYQAQQTALTNMVNAANATYPADRDAAIAAANTTNLGDQSLPCPTGMEKSSGNGTESKTGLGNQNPPYTIDDVINKGLKNSPTIRNLYDQANRRGFSFSLTASNTPTTDPDKKSVVIPSSHSDIDQAVIDLAHELTNASNNNKYNRLDNRASDRTISRENYIRASIKLEMKGLLNQAKVIGEIGRPDLAANNLGGTFPSMYNDYIKGNLTENSLLNKMVDHAYNNFIVEGTQQMLKDYYGNDYDRLQP